MPGRNLNDIERRLMERWDNGHGYTKPRLASIEITGADGLRGLRGVVLPLRYPLVAICGPNGAGKSTLLSLAALAFHSPAGWFVHWGVGRAKPGAGDRTYYRFSDFFQTSPDEDPIGEAKVTWRYSTLAGEQPFEMEKTGNRWGRYGRRFERAVDFLPLTRVLPAVEMAKLTKLFRKPPTPPPATPLNEQYLRHLSTVMGRTYTSADILREGESLFARCSVAGTRYSAFNMGAGEAAVVGLMYLLQRLPDEGVLVVEEIEAGLHPQAHGRLAQVLLEVCTNKRIQVICSSHSELFIDAIPRQARLLIYRSGASLEIVERPSTRYALAKMLGQTMDEIVLYCEDGLAEDLTRAALPSSAVARVRIVAIGDGSTVISQGVSHRRGGNPGRVLCVLDGDTTEAQVHSWLRSHDPHAEFRPDYLIMPGGGLSPERWILNMLTNDNYADALAGQIRCGRHEARDHVQAMTAVAETHNIFHELEKRTKIPRGECRQLTARAVADRNPGFDQLREKVNALLV